MSSLNQAVCGARFSWLQSDVSLLELASGCDQHGNGGPQNSYGAHVDGVESSRPPVAVSGGCFPPAMLETIHVAKGTIWSSGST